MLILQVEKLSSNPLARLRNRAGVTQRQVAEVLDVTVTTVQNWESGRRELRLTPKDIVKLCQTLNCTVEELADGKKRNDGESRD